MRWRHLPGRSGTIISWLLLLALSVPVQGAVRPVYGDRVVRGFLGTIRSTDPLSAVSPIEREVVRQIHAGLVRRDKQGSIVPDLAKELKVSEDGAALTIRLAAGATFHDDTPITAKDVLLSLERWRERWPRGPASVLFAAGEAAQVLDEHTLVLRLAGSAELARAVLADLKASILPGGAPASKLNTIGAGPFAVTAVDADGRSLKLGAFLGCVRGRPYLDELVYKAYPDVRQLVLAHRFRGVEAVGLAAPLPREAESLDRSQRLELPGRQTAWLQLNLDRPPLSLPEVRQAVASSLDREALVSIIMRNEAEPARGFLRTRPALLDPLAPVGEAESRRSSGRPLELVFDGACDLGEVAERLQVDLHARGFRVRPMPLDSTQLVKTLTGGGYDMALGLAWLGEGSAAVDLLDFIARTGEALHLGESDQPLLATDSLEACLELEARAFGQAEVVFLFHRRHYLLASPELKGLVVSPGGLASFEAAWKLP